MSHQCAITRTFAEHVSNVIGFMALRLEKLNEPWRQLRIHDEPHHSAANAILVSVVRAA